jgi:hypothetical protein
MDALAAYLLSNLIAVIMYAEGHLLISPALLNTHVTERATSTPQKYSRKDLATLSR